MSGFVLLLVAPVISRPVERCPAPLFLVIALVGINPSSEVPQMPSLPIRLFVF